LDLPDGRFCESALTAQKCEGVAVKVQPQAHDVESFAVRMNLPAEFQVGQFVANDCGLVELCLQLVKPPLPPPPRNCHRARNHPAFQLSGRAQMSWQQIQSGRVKGREKEICDLNPAPTFIATNPNFCLRLPKFGLCENFKASNPSLPAPFHVDLSFGGRDSDGWDLKFPQLVGWLKIRSADYKVGVNPETIASHFRRKIAT
jgi:hypothetical protein